MRAGRPLLLSICRRIQCGHDLRLAFFPGAPPASYWDFAYFAFVIGSTAQTADVGVSSTRMRRLVMLHGLLAFGFNTSIVALTINLLAGIL